MKISLYIFLIVFVNISLHSQSEKFQLQDTLLIKGLHIIRYEKSEIEKKLRNEVKEKFNKSFEKSIDYKSNNYYFTLSQNNKQIFNESIIYYYLKNKDLDYKNYEIYKFSLEKNLFVDICII